MENDNSSLNDYVITITIIYDNNLYWQINGVEKNQIENDTFENAA